MFNVGDLPGPAAALWEAAAFATGGRGNVTITVGPNELTISRMAMLEAVYLDDPPTRQDVEEWVIATAQRLGFQHTELTQNGTDRNPGQMIIRILIDGLTVTVVGFWDQSRLREVHEEEDSVPQEPADPHVHS